MLVVVGAVVEDEPGIEARDQGQRRPCGRIGNHDGTGTRRLPEVAQHAWDEKPFVRPPERLRGRRDRERRVHGEVLSSMRSRSAARWAVDPRDHLARRRSPQAGIGEARGFDEDGRVAGPGEEGGQRLVPLPEEVPPDAGEYHHGWFHRRAPYFLSIRA